ncbi:hypothetical protein D1P53_001739 [Cryptococcus gattii VGV]|nr:hypothetical protein D1P53_001739 [Cryptococcus gattii VGV]
MTSSTTHSHPLHDVIYEADEIARCIRDGESERIPWEESRMVYEWVDKGAEQNFQPKLFLHPRASKTSISSWVTNCTRTPSIARRSYRPPTIGLVKFWGGIGGEIVKDKSVLGVGGRVKNVSNDVLKEVSKDESNDPEESVPREEEPQNISHL